MTSTITLYRGGLFEAWELTANKLFIIDNIDSYLDSIDEELKIVIDNAQYQKQSLELSIKLALPQRVASPTYATLPIKYVSIKANRDGSLPIQEAEQIGYYFVKSCRWMSQNTIALDLVMDVLNTYQEGRDYIFKDNTRIIREHKDRLVKVGNNYFRNIDYIPENINPILNCGEADNIYKLIQKRTPMNVDWYLIYRNRNNPTPDDLTNPVDCYLIPSEAIEVSTGTITNGRLTGASLQNGVFYYVRISASNTLSLPDGTTISNTNPYWPQANHRYVEIFKNSDGTMTITATATSVFSQPQQMSQTWNVEYINLNYLPCPYMTYSEHKLVDVVDQNWNPSQEWNTYAVSQYISGINLLDRTDPKLIKVIKLPYCPYDFEVNGLVININTSDWNYTEVIQGNNTHLYALSLNNLNTKLQSTIEYLGTDDPYRRFSVGELSPTPSEYRRESDYPSIELESKMFNSEFYLPKLVYDSFSMNIELEKLDNTYYQTQRAFNIIFTMTKTINSKFMFSLANYKNIRSDLNYPNVLAIARNNEEVLYNVPYINYIRTGFNYDVKNKNINATSNWVGVALGAVSAGVSLFAPSATLKIAGVVGSAISMAMSVKGALVSQIQGEEAIKQKILQAQNQASSVAGSDDVDLMSEYASNRLKYLVYECNPIMRNLIKRLFFYTGYASGRMGLPNHNTRCNFDYLECDASFEVINANMSQEILTELTNAFKTGITYIHETSRESDRWDLKQEYENFENSIL